MFSQGFFKFFFCFVFGIIILTIVGQMILYGVVINGAAEYCKDGIPKCIGKVIYDIKQGAEEGGK